MKKQKTNAGATPKYIVRKTGDDVIEFYIIHDVVDPVYLVEQYDYVPFAIWAVGHVMPFDPEDNINACDVYELPIKDIKDTELFYTQEAAIGSAFRLAKKIEAIKNESGKDGTENVAQ